MDFKKISVITPTFNRKDMLETAIKNVMAQDYPNIEHIIVGGGSNDGTQNIMVRRYPNIRFICNLTKGMYDALNKGLKIPTGKQEIASG
jgi:glycosyltransferase involved in cell wall biosynthesis